MASCASSRAAKPMDALRTAVSAWGATQALPWPPTVEQARALTAFSPSALAAFGRLRAGQQPIDPDPSLGLAAGFLYQLNGVRPDQGPARALDAYFVVAAEHGFNASTFTARVTTSTRSDIASAVDCGDRDDEGAAPWRRAFGGRRPARTRSGRRRGAEHWIATTLTKGDRLMGFGHRVYRAYDPRAGHSGKSRRACRTRPEWLQKAIDVEDVALRGWRRGTPIAR